MFKVKIFIWEKGLWITREKRFDTFEKAFAFYRDVKTICNHGKLFCYNRVTQEF